jgi:hypothetical protein
MTFALVRAGLPNSIVVLALALAPIVALAIAPTKVAQRDHAPAMTVSAVDGAIQAIVE